MSEKQDEVRTTVIPGRTTTENNNPNEVVRIPVTPDTVIRPANNPNTEIKTLEPTTKIVGAVATLGATEQETTTQVVDSKTHKASLGKAEAEFHEALRGKLEPHRARFFKRKAKIKDAIDIAWHTPKIEPRATYVQPNLEASAIAAARKGYHGRDVISVLVASGWTVEKINDLLWKPNIEPTESSTPPQESARSHRRATRPAGPPDNAELPNGFDIVIDKPRSQEDIKTQELLGQNSKSITELANRLVSITTRDIIGSQDPDFRDLHIRGTTTAQSLIDSLEPQVTIFEGIFKVAQGKGISSLEAESAIKLARRVIDDATLIFGLNKREDKIPSIDIDALDEYRQNSTTPSGVPSDVPKIHAGQKDVSAEARLERFSARFRANRVNRAIARAEKRKEKRQYKAENLEAERSAVKARRASHTPRNS